jgi:hypothetical protein
MSIENLESMFGRACPIDLNEGRVAYERYNAVMRGIAEHYGFTLGQVIAAFVSLSPNSDYKGNLRSTVSVLDGIRRGVDPEDVTVATYKHCRRRAYAYAMGHRDFLAETKGPKIMSFYHNVLDPFDNRWVTIDGHMSAIWQNKKLTMREALIPRRTYIMIRDDVIRLAFRHYLIPNQMQAILWFTRKRVENVVYDPQLQLFGDPSDVWETFRDVRTIHPYPLRNANVDAEKVQQGRQASMVYDGGATPSEGNGRPEPEPSGRSCPDQTVPR